MLGGSIVGSQTPFSGFCLLSSWCMLCEGKWMKHDEIMLIEMIPTAQAKMKTRGPKTSQDVTVYDHQQIDHVRYEV